MFVIDPRYAVILANSDPPDKLRVRFPRNDRPTNNFHVAKRLPWSDQDVPLLIAGVAFLLGAAGMWGSNGSRAFLAAALMMVLFFQAARLALAVFDPYLSSRPLAEAFNRSPAGQLIVDRHYYYFSSLFFYTNRRALLLNGRFNNLVYGSYAPGAPDVFIDDGQWKSLWLTPTRYYLVAAESALPRLENLVGRDRLVTVASSGGKVLLTNTPE